MRRGERGRGPGGGGNLQRAIAGAVSLPQLREHIWYPAVPACFPGTPKLGSVPRRWSRAPLQQGTVTAGRPSAPRPRPAPAPGGCAARLDENGCADE